MSRVIKVNPLSQSSIESAVEELKEYRRMLKEFPSKYTKALSEYFYEQLNINAPNMYNHWIMNIEKSEGKATGIFIFDGIVQFIEFGAGYIGMMKHDGINEEWLSKLPPPYNQGYNVGTGYIRYQDDPPKSFWVFKDEEGYKKTQGQPANPFIYNSVQELLDARVRIAKSLMRT